MLRKEEKALFAKSPRAASVLNSDPAMPSAAFMKLTFQLPCKHMALLIQPRTGHILLNKHLARIGKTASPACPTCGRHSETVHHFLFRCKPYEVQRKQLEITLKRHGKSTKTLLARPKALPVLFKYVNDMNWFQRTWGSMELEEE